LLAIDESFIKIDIEYLGTVLDLIDGDLYSCFIVSFLDKFLELDASRDIAPFTDIDEPNDVSE